jgi:hypothetical protein
MVHPPPTTYFTLLRLITVLHGAVSGGMAAELRRISTNKIRSTGHGTL